MNTIAEILAGDINISKKERLISAAGGVALIILGIIEHKKHPGRTWAEIATGAALLLRGATGHCPVNAAMNRNTAADELTETAADNFELLAE